MGIYGQDWASYQSATPDTAGLDFAFTKVTEGTGYINPKWTQQRDHAKAAGLPWGGYHYPHMGNSVQAEADFFLSQVAWQPGDMVVLDWEGYDTANQTVSKAHQASYKDAWLKYVKGKLPHNPVGMYCNSDYWRNVDTSGYYGDFLWIATAELPAGQPGIKDPWLFHQYGASGVDRDYCHLATRADLRAWTLSFQPQETDMTPDQAAQLKELHDNLLQISSLTEKDAKGNPVSHGAGYYLAHIHYDALKIVAAEAAQTAAITAMAQALGKVDEAIDVPALVAQVQQAVNSGVTQALSNINIHLDTTS